MTTAVLMIPPFLQFADSTGKPYAGGFVYTYAAGTTTPLVTYTDATAATPAANPIVLDSAGRCQIWGVGSYKFVVKDSAGNTVQTTDNVSAYTVPGNSGTPLFDTFSGDGSTTVFTLSQSGGTVAKELLVWIDAGGGKGFDLQSPTAYSVSGTSLTFNSAPTSGSSNIYVVAPNILANAAAASAASAAGSATAASASSTLASQWATLTTGQVASTDYSSKAYAIGGTGVTTTSGKGAAKEWATTTGGKVDTAEYSAKEYAIGTTTRGASGGGSSKDWASYTGGTVDDTLYSAKYNANLSAASASAAASSASAASSSATAASGAAAAAAAAATSLANEWLFASSTTMADPSTGNFRLDNATFASVTNIALSALSGDSGNPNLHSFIMTWDDSTNSPRGIIRIEKNATNFIMLGVTGSITDNTTWVEIPVTVIASAGSFSASDVTFINFTQYGNNGTLTASGTPTANQLGIWTSATSIKGVTSSGDVTVDGSGVFTIGAGKVTEAMQVLADNTTNNVSTSKHGLMPKAVNTAGLYYDAQAGQTNPALNSVLTGYVSGAGTVAATDTILSAIQKLNGNIANALGKAPTQQVLTTGTGATYTTPAGCTLIKIREVGGGGGAGGAGGTTAPTGGSGNTTTFNSISVAGGSGGTGVTGAGNGVGGAAGTGGTGSVTFRVVGMIGFSATGGGTGSTIGGNGGNTPIGSGGIGTAGTGNPTGNAGTNGGGGGGVVHVSSTFPSGGGGSGEYAEFQIASPAGTYTYTIGTGGAGGIGTGTNAQTGGAGGNGLIIVDEFY